MLLIYGATGYTGGLIARMAAAAGIPLLVGGRSADRLQPLAAQLGVEHRAFTLEDPQLDGVTVLLNCAGSFAQTSPPLVRACLGAGAHYLDITGEAAEIEAVRAHDATAQAAGVMLMPGVGFGIVPTDCLAAYVAARLPDATQLTLAFETVGGVSQGTLVTLLGGLHQPGVQRRDGQLVPARPAERVRQFDFGDGPQAAVLNPWRGDTVSAFHTTGIPTITTYAAFPGAVRFLMRARWLHGLWGSGPVQALLRRVFRRLPAGPPEDELQAGYTRVWAEATHGDQCAAARLHGPEAYRFTGLTATAIAQRVLAGEAPAGYQTPAGVYGADFVLTLPDVRRTDA